MKLLLCIILLLSTTALGQAADANYSRGGKLIGLSNLLPLSDCSVKSYKGKVRDIKIEGDSVRFELKAKTGGGPVQLDMARVADTERGIIFKNLIRKNYPVIVNGYACDAGPVKAISIERY